MKSSIKHGKIDGKICTTTAAQERHESQLEVKGLKISIPTPLGAVTIDCDQYNSGSFNKESGGTHYHQDGTVVRDTEPKEPSDVRVAEGYKFTGTLLATALGQINSMQAADQERRKGDQAHERAMLDLKHRHACEMARLADELEAAKHARIQASKHAS